VKPQISLLTTTKSIQINIVITNPKGKDFLTCKLFSSKNSLFLLLYKNAHFRPKRGCLHSYKHPLNVQNFTFFPKPDF